MDKELAAKFAAEVREQTSQAEEQPKVEWALEAKKSAAKKLMAAFQSQDEEQFLTALAELKEMDDE